MNYFGRIYCILCENCLHLTFQNYPPIYGIILHSVLERASQFSAQIFLEVSFFLTSAWLCENQLQGKSGNSGRRWSVEDSRIELWLAQGDDLHHKLWWKEETLKMQPNNLLNLKMCSHIFKIKFYLIPSLSRVLGGLVKRSIAGPSSKSFRVY